MNPSPSPGPILGTFDILVIGAGPAGLAAADVVAASGRRVAVLDDNPHPGGQIWRRGPDFPPTGLARTLTERLADAPNVVFLQGFKVVQWLAAQQVLVEGEPRGGVLRYRQLILAPGARELLLPFPGWTLPGVTGAGGLQALLKGGLPIAGRRVVVAGSGPLLFAAAATARARGAQVLAIVEQAGPASVARFALGLGLTPAKLLQAVRLRWDLRATPYLLGAHIADASATDAAGGLAQVTVRQGRHEHTLACERLACGYGLVPNTRLAEALGCALQAGAVRVDALQRTSLADVFAAGECTGIGGMERACAEGRIAGHAALGTPRDLAAARALYAARARWQRFGTRLQRAFAPAPVLRRLATDNTIFCRCEDVRYDAVAAHADWRSAKLQTRCGMGACQGQICGTAAAFCLGWAPEPAQALRAPFAPTRIATLMQLDDPALQASPEKNHEPQAGI
jgi:NADPH-dependent 2,4-dienoyl-CoA reductase/sulfur reductase-like enzyme